MEHKTSLVAHNFEEVHYGDKRFYQCDCGLIIGADHVDKIIEMGTVMEVWADGSVNTFVNK